MYFFKALSPKNKAEFCQVLGEVKLQVQIYFLSLWNAFVTEPRSLPGFHFALFLTKAHKAHSGTAETSHSLGFKQALLWGCVTLGKKSLKFLQASKHPSLRQPE